MKIEECKNITDYLRICNVQSIDDLTDEQVIEWAEAGKMGLQTELSVDTVMFGMFGVKPNKQEAIRLLKQAIKEKKTFYCSYVENESCDGPIEKNNYFDMAIR